MLLMVVALVIDRSEYAERIEIGGARSLKLMSCWRWRWGRWSAEAVAGSVVGRVMDELCGYCCSTFN